MGYIDFYIRIDPAPAGSQDYPVFVISSPAGEAHNTMHFPFDQQTLHAQLSDLENALDRLRTGSRTSISNEEQIVKDFGQKLFNLLIAGLVRDCYRISKHRATQEKLGLRIKLHIQASELVAVPWELLYDSPAGEYLCLCRDTPLVRYLEREAAMRPLRVDGPLRILGMIASPTDQVKLSIQHEQKLIHDALAELEEQKLIEVEWLEGQTLQDLHNAIASNGPWHVFHFIGHGGFDQDRDEGFIALRDAKGRTQRVFATDLARMITHDSLQLVLLNTCEGARGGMEDRFSSIASILARRDIPAVVAMQYKITDQAALTFAEKFYRLLARGRPVDTVVTEARLAVSMDHKMEWATPVFYMRSPDGQLFTMTSLRSTSTLKLPLLSRPVFKRREIVIGMAGTVVGSLGGAATVAWFLSQQPKSIPTPVIPAQLVVGGKLDTEAQLLTEMYSLLLSKAGFDVKTQLGHDSNNVAFDDLMSGAITVYPEFLQAGLKKLQLDSTHNQQQDFLLVQRGYKQQFGITWLDQAVHLDDHYCLATLQETATQYSLKKISDLAREGPDNASHFVVAVPPDGQEFVLPLLQRIYGITFDKAVVYSEDKTFLVMRDDSAQFGLCYVTDPVLQTSQFLVLEDDRKAFPADTPSPLVRADILNVVPQLAPVLNKLAPHLSGEVSTSLQARVNSGESLEHVAQTWLASLKLP